jgi:hypothetical protein
MWETYFFVPKSMSSLSESLIQDGKGLSIANASPLYLTYAYRYAHPLPVCGYR